MKDFEQFKREQFKKKPGLKKAYDELAPQYELAVQVIEARLKKGLSQTQLAKRMKTSQSAVARLESGDYNATIDILKRVAQATNTRLRVQLES
ncbi:helix-turn-helix transcriptional regulator [Candidatus Berkelbacteria bacterium]|nr:helix-turn-helix transcriptional regulator [Candidatus Berkelbacteria bacterium]